MKIMLMRQNEIFLPCDNCMHQSTAQPGINISAFHFFIFQEGRLALENAAMVIQFALCAEFAWLFCFVPCYTQVK